MLPEKILILRFSAMGDVLLLVPVLKSLTAAHPQVSVTLVTRPRFASFFAGIDGVKVFEADVDYTYNGMLGLRDLFRALLRKGDYDVVIDMHDHIRTIVLRSMFKLFGSRVIVFDKGRKEKKELTRKENKVVSPLPHTVLRYKKAFEKAGFSFPLLNAPYLLPTDESIAFVKEWLVKNNLEKKEKWIGIAPFALHQTKIWPVNNYIALIETLTGHGDYKFFLFGGGKKEMGFFFQLKERFPEQCIVVAEQMKIRDEIALMQYLDLMICLDSSNMHLSALAGVPLLSIWGGTHPDAGFGPFGKDASDILQISRDELYCRPCSVYGKETCHRGDFACLNRITVQKVAAEVLRKA